VSDRCVETKRQWAVARMQQACPDTHSKHVASRAFPRYPQSRLARRVVPPVHMMAAETVLHRCEGLGGGCRTPLRRAVTFAMWDASTVELPRPIRLRNDLAVTNLRPYPTD
jgi:hypothetical protein